MNSAERSGVGHAGAPMVPGLPASGRAGILPAHARLPAVPRRRSRAPPWARRQGGGAV